MLYLRDNPEHVAQAEAHGIQPIDLVVVNLYPFEKTIAKPGTTLEEAIEQIDIGGPSMLRSAAKNYRSVTVVVDPADYADVLENMRDNDGATTLKLRERLGIKVFVTTSKYDRAIANYLNQRAGSDLLLVPLAARSWRGCATAKTRTRPARSTATSTSTSRSSTARNSPITTSSISRAASELIEEFSEPTVAILKHTNPCGVGSDPDLREAWDKAFATDKQAPFGGIIISIARSREPLARAICEIFSRGDHRAGFRAGRPRAAAEKEEPAADEKAAAAAAEFRRRGRLAHSLRRPVACWCRAAMIRTEMAISRAKS